MKTKILLETKQLQKTYRVRKGIIQAVSDVDLTIYKGETLALVGESGCGKSTLGKVILRLLKEDSGEIWFDGQELTKLRGESLRQMRKRIQMVFQDPYASLNPRMNVKNIIEEPLKAFRVPLEQRDAMIEDLMKKTGIPEEYLKKFPHQFSGGQRQRIGIARALALHPEFIVCDEPVSALDVSIQAQTLNLLKELQKDMNLTYLFISHDMAVVHYISDRVCVMFLGRICEVGNTREIYENPLHPYTKLLLDASPKIGNKMKVQENEKIIEMPSPVNPPSGCRFHTRCPYAQEVCGKEVPQMQEIGGRMVACHFPLKEK